MPATVVPTSFLFRYRIPVSSVAKLRKKGKRLLALKQDARIATPSELNRAENPVELRMAFNEHGIGIEFEVTGKTKSPQCHPGQPESGDGITVWIDTRDTKNIHRASRYCHQFHLLPTSGRSNQTALLQQAKIPNAREDAPFYDGDAFKIQSEFKNTGYRIECWFPAETLNGFSPADQPQIGFYYLLRDIELGQIGPGVSGDFPISYDPSLWLTLELKK